MGGVKKSVEKRRKQHPGLDEVIKRELRLDELAQKERDWKVMDMDYAKKACAEILGIEESTNNKIIVDLE